MQNKFLMDKDSNIIKSRRPLSPHLGIYKPQISSVLSIGHRLSGVGLFLVLSVLCWVFVIWAFSGCGLGSDNNCCARFMNLAIVKFILVLASYGYFYHFCTGIRHLMWDAGYGFSINSIDKTGWAAIAASFCLTCIYWLFM